MPFSVVHMGAFRLRQPGHRDRTARRVPRRSPGAPRRGRSRARRSDVPQSSRDRVRRQLEDLYRELLECYHCSVAHPSFSKAIDVAPDVYALETPPSLLSQFGPPRNGGGGVYDAQGEITRGQFIFFPEHGDQRHAGPAEPLDRPDHPARAPTGPTATSTTSSPRVPTKRGSRSTSRSTTGRGGGPNAGRAGTRRDAHRRSRPRRATAGIGAADRPVSDARHRRARRIGAPAPPTGVRDRATRPRTSEVARPRDIRYLVRGFALVLPGPAGYPLRCSRGAEQ